MFDEEVNILQWKKKFMQIIENLQYSTTVYILA